MKRGMCPGCRRARILDEQNGEQCAECRAMKPQTFDKGKPTPWAVLCPIHGQVFLDAEEYNAQMSRANARWTCPAMDSDEYKFGLCGAESEWDDDNYEAAEETEEEARERAAEQKADQRLSEWKDNGKIGRP